METNNTSIVAINKFFYYSMNYPVVKIEYPSITGSPMSEYLPDFFNAFPLYIREHLAGKWRACTTGKTDSYGYINKFYGELDSTYRVMMLRYIMENYNDEIKIRFPEM